MPIYRIRELSWKLSIDFVQIYAMFLFFESFLLYKYAILSNTPICHFLLSIYTSYIVISYIDLFSNKKLQLFIIKTIETKWGYAEDDND